MNKIYIYIVFCICWLISNYFLIKNYLPSNFVSTFQSIKEVFYLLMGAFLLLLLVRKNKRLQVVQDDEKRLCTLINSMVDLVTFKDENGRWIEANDFCLKIFQLENVEYRGKTDAELSEYSSFCRDAFYYCEASDEEAWRTRKVTRAEERIAQPDGTEKIFDTIKVPLFHPSGQRKGIVVIGRDITDLHHVQEQLRRTEKLSVVGELAASVAHEIRNPLTSLKGFVQLLDEKDSEYHHYYDIMNDELERINHITSELLLLAKPQTLKFMKTDLKKLINDVLTLLEIQALQHNVSISVDYEDNLEEIECEPNQLKQLFINLIKNGIEASIEGGTVGVNIKRNDGESVSILIKDNGCGMSKERLERIGEPFYSSKEKGTGLGLMVSFKIVQVHHGEISFNSVIGKGTEIMIQLPIRQP